MNQSNPATLILTFVVGFLTMLVLGFWVQRSGLFDSKKVRSRLRDLTKPDDGTPEVEEGFFGQLTAALPKIGGWSDRGENSRQRDDVKTRLLRAGYFHPNAVNYFMGVRFLAFLIFPALGFGLGYMIAPKNFLLILTATVGGLSVGFLGPSFWLGSQIAQRQRQLTRAMPDALDMLVLCLDSGSTFQAALQRVCDELQMVHPILTIELKIVLREMQLGLSGGDSLLKLANRCDLEELRELAMVLTQSERFGASISKALRTHAETARLQRQQKAEETAQKAAVKIIFPTMLCIFPAIFIVILGPVAYQSGSLFGR